MQAANSRDDDVLLFSDDSRKKVSEELYFLRQQVNRSNSKRPNFCLADFVAPISSGINDYLGAFILQRERVLKSYQKNMNLKETIIMQSWSNLLEIELQRFSEMIHCEVEKNFGVTRK